VRGARARKIAARECFTGLFTTSLKPGELITEIQFPIPLAGMRSAYVKMKHPASGFAIVGAAAAVRVGRDGRAQDVRLALTGAGPHAYRAGAVEAILRGKTLDEATVRAAMEHAAEGIDLLEDLAADAAYRAQLVRVYGTRAVLATLA
jgi:carbon-monoxide dehydrogenase medium subunit